MLKESYVTTSGTETRCLKCISWTGIIVGAFVALGLSFLLYLLTAGLGLSTMTLSQQGLLALGIGGFIFIIILSFLIMFISGWITGLIARGYCYRPSFGLLHGFTAWCLALLLAIFSHSAFLGSLTPDVEGYNVKGPTTQISRNVDTTTTAVPSTRDTRTGVTTEEAANTAGMGILATFFIFLTGAIASSLGGYFGVKSSDETVVTKRDEGL